MKNQFLLFSFLVATVLMISCSGSVKDNPIEKSTATKQPLSVSPTAMPPEITATPPASSCPEKVNDLPENLMSGIIVILDSSWDKKDAYLWDIEAHTKTDLPGKEDRSFPPDPKVSPNRKLLAYFEYLKNEENTLNPVRLSIVNSKSEVMMSTENTWKNWTGLIGWLDDSHLMLDQFAGESPHPTFILNPFTGETKTVVADYPNIYKSSQHYMGWWGPFATTMTIFDPSLSFVIYPLNPSEIVLFDAKKESELTRIDIGNLTGSAPQWSPNYQNFAIDISKRGNDPYGTYYSDEIYIVDRSGKTSKLTDFAGVSRVIDIQQYSWSPDGNYLAFWYSTDPKEYKYELATLDVVNRKITTYCVTDYIKTDTLQVYSPVWSPDGQQLLVRGKFGDENSSRTDKDSTVILVDTVKYFVGQIAENAIPLGWMIGSE